MFEEKVISLVTSVLKRTVNSFIESKNWQGIFQNSAKVILSI